MNGNWQSLIMLMKAFRLMRSHQPESFLFCVIGTLPVSTLPVGAILQEAIYIWMGAVWILLDGAPSRKKLCEFGWRLSGRLMEVVWAFDGGCLGVLGRPSIGLVICPEKDGEHFRGAGKTLHRTCDMPQKDGEHFRDSGKILHRIQLEAPKRWY